MTLKRRTEMSTTYAELLAADLKRQKAYLHIAEYDAAGYTGKGFTVLNGESDSDHRDMSSKAFVTLAPNATLLESNISHKVSSGVIEYCTVTLDGEVQNLGDAIDRYGINVITKSWSGTCPDAIEEYFKELQETKGVIFLCSAGNKADETGMWVRENTAIAVSASKLLEDGTIEIRYYGSDDEVDFTFFMSSGTGTSAAAPALAAIIVRLMSKYGVLTQTQCIALLKLFCVYVGDEVWFGYGLPVPPIDDVEGIDEIINAENIEEEETIVTVDEVEEEEVKEEIEEVSDVEENIIVAEESMDFTDVEETDWFYITTKACIEAGLLNGDGDDTFNPERTVTRAELSAFGYNILQLIKLIE
jgi:hypothetical protein